MYNIKELKKIYTGKKVFMTGHTGFKGAYACVLLKYLGAKVYGYALKEEKDSLYAILKKEYKKKKRNIVQGECYGDIRDYNKLRTYMQKVKPDYILHMAAQPLVLRGYKEPLYTYEVNVMGTAYLMQAICDVYNRNKKVISVLNVTTDKVYKNDDMDDIAFNEDDKLAGRDPYASSKSCSELVTYAYNKSFFDNKSIRVSTARAGNVIGGGDMNENRIIPDAIRAIKCNKDMHIRHPLSIRPYQYVLEPIIIYLNIMAYQMNDKKYIGTYNIGPDRKDCLSTKEIVKRFYDTYYKKDEDRVKVVYDNECKTLHEAAFLRLDNSLIKKVFGYKKIYGIDEMMRYTADVYRLIIEKKELIPYLYDSLSF